eukprot:8416252-Pyramimonas_sp.AAC.1
MWISPQRRAHVFISWDQTREWREDPFQNVALALARVLYIRQCSKDSYVASTSQGWCTGAIEGCQDATVTFVRGVEVPGTAI